MIVGTFILSLVLAAYTALLAWIIFRCATYREFPLVNYSTNPGISVVIPFRNEAHNLGRLLASLAAQRYSGAWELLLVNDGSDDSFASVLAPFLTTFPVPLSIVQSVTNHHVKLTSKQHALDTGVAKAKYEWLVFTDADMEFSPDWLSSWAGNAGRNIDLVFGHTRIAGERGGLFRFVQRFQLEFLFSAAYAFHVSAIGGSCMGNNVLVKTTAYRAVGGQAGIGYSIVEDRDLYDSFLKRKMSVAPSSPFRAYAATYPCESLSDYYHQMLRWARGGFSPDSRLLWAGLLLTVQNVSFGALLAGLLPLPAAIIAFVNFALTWAFVDLAFRKSLSSENSLLFPAYWIWLLIETAVFLISFVVTPRVLWKRRKI
jgi:cellulose synthase/poly-beta-1,6-N-acetylglucosamine synthase-like glycosyltransferase